MANYIYLQSERHLWTVGFYAPNGFFQPEKDFGVDEGGAEAAARRVAWLNSGATDGVQALKDLEATVREVLRLADRFDARTCADLQRIVHEIGNADFPATEAVMFFNGLKRALMLFADEGAQTFYDQAEASDAPDVSILCGFCGDKITGNTFGAADPNQPTLQTLRFCSLDHLELYLKAVCVCEPNAFLGRGECGHFSYCPRYTKFL